MKLKDIKSFIIIFGVFSFIMLIIINDFSFDFLNDISVVITFSENSVKTFSINYFILAAIVTSVYVAIALAGANVLGSGLSDSSITILSRIATIILIFALISPFYTELLSYSSNVIVVVISYSFDILYFVSSFANINSEGVE